MHGKNLLKYKARLGELEKEDTERLKMRKGERGEI